MIKNIKARFFSLEFNVTQQYLLLILFILVALALRLYKLGEWSFWVDELFTWRDANRFFSLNLIRQSTLRFLILVSGRLLGVNEWNLRIIPALIGVFSIPILYFPIRKIFGVAVALGAMLLLAVSPWHLLWSQNVRFYVTLFLFYTLALLTFYLGIETGRIIYLFLSMVFLGLATLESQIALMFVPVVVAYIFLLKILPFEQPAGLRLRNLMIFFTPGLIVALFFSVPFFLNGVWGKYFGGNVNTTPIDVFVGAVYYIGLPVVCLGTIGALHFLFKKNRAALLLTLAAILPLLTVMFLSLIQFVSDRYVFLSLMSWLILASMAAKELFLQIPKGAKSLAIGVWLILLLTSLSQDIEYFNQNGHRENWKDALAFVQQHKKADEKVLITFNVLGKYYLPGQTDNIREEELDEIHASTRKVWFVEKVSFTRRHPRVYNWLENNTETVASFEAYTLPHHYQIRVRVYDPATKDDKIVVR